MYRNTSVNAWIFWRIVLVHRQMKEQQQLLTAYTIFFSDQCYEVYNKIVFTGGLIEFIHQILNDTGHFIQRNLLYKTP